MSEEPRIDMHIEDEPDGSVVFNTVVGSGRGAARRRDVYFTVSRVAQVVGVTDGRIRQLLLAGRFPNAVKVTGTWLIPYGDVSTHLRYPDARRKEYPRQGTLSEVAGDESIT